MKSGIKSAAGVLALVAVVVIAALPSVWLSRYGVNLGDEPYQIMNGMDYRNAPMAPLSNWLAGLYGEMTGWSWLSFRYLAVALNLLSVIMGVLYMYRKTGRWALSAIVGFVCAFFIGLIQNASALYGWDRWTVFGLMPCVLTLLSYIDRPALWKAALLGCLSAVLGLFRVPNFVIVAMVPFAMLLIGYNGREWDRKKWVFGRVLTSVAIYLAVTALTSVGLLWALYGGVGEWLAYFESNYMGSHGTWVVVRSILYQMPMFLTTVAIMWLYYHLLVAADGFGEWMGRAALLMSLAGLHYLLLSEFDNLQWMPLVYASGLVALASGCVVWNNRGELWSGPVVRVAAVLLLACVPFVGSNTGVLKMLSWPVLPVIFVYLLPYFTRRMAVYSAVAAVALLGYAYSGVRNATFGDSGIKETTERLDCGVASGLYTNKDRAVFMEALYCDFSPYANDSTHRTVVVRRGVNYSAEYLFGSRSGFNAHRWDLKGDDSFDGGEEWFEQQVARKPVAVLVMVDSIKSERVNELLSRDFVKSVERPRYRVYVSK